MPVFSNPVAFDVSPALSDLAKNATPRRSSNSTADEEIRPDRGPNSIDQGFSGDGAISSSTSLNSASTLAISAPSVSFDGLSNQDNFNVLRRRPNPPDPNGEVGPNHYVEMVNLVFAVYSKTGTRLLGPVDTGTLWAGFAVPDCTDPSGDPIVIYDQFSDRWLLTQFTTRGLDDPSLPLRQVIRQAHTIAMPSQPATTSQTTRSTGYGLTPTSLPRVSSATRIRAFTASVYTGLSGIKWSMAIRMPVW
jgi:hypothetical protein